MRTIGINVKGKVQGVFFRQSTREKANELGITGEVENLEDGSVYIRATGDEGQLEELKKWCQQGPARAKVSTVETVELPLQNFSSFIILRRV